MKQLDSVVEIIARDVTFSVIALMAEVIARRFFSLFIALMALDILKNGRQMIHFSNL